MDLALQILPYAQIILGVILIAAILLQQTSAGVGGALGGNDSGGFYNTRRGFEKFLFHLSIWCGIIFALLALVSMVIQAQ